MEERDMTGGRQDCIPEVPFPKNIKIDLETSNDGFAITT